jgi:hypothetical protein
MTCIVGIQHRRRVVIAGDSAGVAGYSVTVRADEKVFARDGFLFGFTSSFRMGQILRYDAELPAVPGRGADLTAFMVREFVPAVRKAFSEGGFLTKRNEEESGGTFLVGLRGNLFSVESDFQVGRAVDGYMAVGVGDDLALGVLHATRRGGWDPELRATLALEAAAYHNGGVCAPFHAVAA